MLEMRTLLLAVSTDTVVLIVLLLLVGAYAWLEKRKAAKKQEAQEEPAPQAVPAAAEPAPAEKLPEAKGTGGTILLHDVPEREAAMVMAVVAHRLGKPLNQLRFKSIREVKKK